jgi:restriction system protein
MLGAKSIYADECYKGNFIGSNFDIDIDLTNQLPDNWREFNQKFIPVWLKKHQGKSKIAAGLSCGYLWTIAKGIKNGDIVLCPNGQGSYYIGEVLDTYSYHPEGVLPHRRTVKWYPNTIERLSMSEALRNSTGSIGTVSEISKYAEEIEMLIGGTKPPTIISTDDTVEDPSVFALEKHLEEFLVQNWKQTELGKDYDIYEEDGELVGQQYPSDTGPIDILAISKDKNTLLVVELKKGQSKRQCCRPNTTLHGFCERRTGRG